MEPLNENKELKLMKIVGMHAARLLRWIDKNKVYKLLLFAKYLHQSAQGDPFYKFFLKKHLNNNQVYDPYLIVNSQISCNFINFLRTEITNNSNRIDSCFCVSRYLSKIKSCSLLFPSTNFSPSFKSTCNTLLPISSENNISVASMISCRSSASSNLLLTSVVHSSTSDVSHSSSFANFKSMCLPIAQILGWTALYSSNNACRGENTLELADFWEDNYEKQRFRSSIKVISITRSRASRIKEDAYRNLRVYKNLLRHTRRDKVICQKKNITEKKGVFIFDRNKICKGYLLIAHPLLFGVWERTVILLTNVFRKNGFVEGVILNKQPILDNQHMNQKEHVQIFPNSMETSNDQSNNVTISKFRYNQRGDDILDKIYNHVKNLLYIYSSYIKLLQNSEKGQVGNVFSSIISLNLLHDVKCEYSSLKKFERWYMKRDLKREDNYLKYNDFNDIIRDGVTCKINPINCYKVDECQKLLQNILPEEKNSIKIVKMKGNVVTEGMETQNFYEHTPNNKLYLNRRGRSIKDTNVSSIGIRYSFGGPLSSITILHNEESISNTTIMKGCIYSGINNCRTNADINHNSKSYNYNNNSNNRSNNFVETENIKGMTPLKSLSSNLLCDSYSSYTQLSNCNNVPVTCDLTIRTDGNYVEHKELQCKRLRYIVGVTEWEMSQLLGELRCGRWLLVKIEDLSVLRDVTFGKDGIKSPFGDALWKKLVCSVSNGAYEDFVGLPPSVIDRVVFGLQS